MAGNPQSQHRCVFVGNIPYDATEEQLVQICEEVGPVVSFRLVIDRDTGKPKGYGFCEYKDEETALSARRNLQGYEINGRQLRVDFAENDKNADRNREQGRGGPGIPSNVDPLKQLGGPAGQSSLHQPMGDSVAVAAATVMAGALGSGQVASTLNQIGLQSRPMLGTDPLTHHLAKFSRSQLIEVMSALKVMAIQNKEQARQLLHATPNLPNALFQLQMPNIRQASAQQVHPLMQSAQTLPGLPPLPQNKVQSDLLPYAQENRVLTGVPNQKAAIQQLSTIPQIQLPQLVQNQVLQPRPNSAYDHPMPQNAGPSLIINPRLPAAGFQTTNSNHKLVFGDGSNNNIPSIFPTENIDGVLGRGAPLWRLLSALAMGPSQAVPMLISHHICRLLPWRAMVTPFRHRRPSSSSPSTMLENIDLKGRGSVVIGQSRVVSDTMDQVNRASKLVKLNGSQALPSSQAVNVVAQFPTSNIPGRQAPRAEETLKSDKQQATQLQVPSDVDRALLQQVLSLTQEQLSSLPPDQQQQLIQLQQMLRQAT
ncbi:mRNA splicing factor [Striga asiatica]|uniref:mRNA splicing factor n=1 Tax=Striga asiatica TaxID=4170 RepID=A0A5A7QR79_STRAF|nr:mRNA splicing factor [Striga asiatica]